MATNSKEAQLTLNIVKVDDRTDAEYTYQLVEALMRVLKDMDVESVTLQRQQDSRPGAKGDLFNGLLVALLPTAIPRIMEFLQEWVLHHEDHIIRAKLQRGDQSAEIEYPANMSSVELKKHLEVIKRVIDG